MACKNVCKLCPNLIISQAVTFTAGTGLIINLPAGNYNDNQKYCIVVAQSIPAATTITAPVFVTIGAGTEPADRQLLQPGHSLRHTHPHQVCYHRQDQRHGRQF